MKFVIIGAGVAGISAAQKIRENAPDAQISIIGDEQYLPYNRYLLTRFLADEVDEQTLEYVDYNFFTKNAITFRKGESVKSVDTDNQTVLLNHNEKMEYDKLLIATGARQLLDNVLQPFAKQILTHYSLKDVFLNKQKLAKAKNIVVFGNSMGTLDLLSGLKKLNKKITYIVKNPIASFPLIQSQEPKEMHDFLTEKGIKILTEDRIVEISDNKVTTLKGKKIKADLVFGWNSRKPNVDFVKNTPISIETGILVNNNFESSVKNVYAAGDCVQIYHPKIKNYWINFGWPNALEQGRVAGENMTGSSAEYQIHETLILNLMGKPLKARWWD